MIGTNILRPIKSSVSDSHVKVPHNWDIAFSALDAGVNLVKSTNKRPIKVGPMSVLTVSGICKSKTVLETVGRTKVADKVKKKYQRKRTLLKLPPKRTKRPATGWHGAVAAMKRSHFTCFQTSTVCCSLFPKTTILSLYGIL